MSSSEGKFEARLYARQDVKNSIPPARSWVAFLRQHSGKVLPLDQSYS